jgi:hypothetical protein
VRTEPWPRDEIDPGAVGTSWKTFAFRAILCHVATYVVAGLAASQLLDYAGFWSTPEMAHMRPLDSPWVAAGPALQIVRGGVLGVVLYPFRTIFLQRRGGWLQLWALLAGVGILSAYGPTPGSLEGIVYTRMPLASHLRGLPEVFLQSLAFSGCLVAWYRRPSRVWPILLGSLSGFALLASLAGVLLG